jgi:CRISPR-associated protein Cmr2
MTVLHISIGPVQGFLAASRKTRDLKNGSQILLDCVRAIAMKLLGAEWNLVFPAADATTIDNADAANILVAVHDEPQKIEDMLMVCRCEAIKVIKEKYKAACHHAQYTPPALHVDSQIESFLEFFAGWASAENYKQANEQASRNLAASKSLRHFKQPDSECRPKSSLMPDFESILEYDDGFKLQNHRPESTFLKAREHLDAVSFAKRFCDRSKFPSTRKIAVASLLKKADKSTELAVLQNLANDEADEGDILFWYEDELDGAGIDLEEAKLARCNFLKAHNEGKAPRRYFAVIHADGDSMGEALKRISDETEHAKFSMTIGEFARSVKDIVEQSCGTHVFAGGDDVVALLPVQTALSCAEELRKKFWETAPDLTLTVGVAFCPTENNLQDCIAFAKSLETFGKKLEGKNALAVGARVRSGSDIMVRGSWKGELHAQINRVLDLYINKEIPRGFVSDVAELVRLTAGWEEGKYNTEAMKREFDRIRNRKDPVPPETILPKFTLSGLAQLYAMLKIGHFLTRTGADE